MTFFTGFLRYAGLFVLLWGVSACADDQETAVSASALAGQSAAGSLLSVYKSPSCGCCSDWIDHIEAAGFKTSVYHPANLNRIKADRGVGPRYGSCHTAISSKGYVFEGHIPARYIRQFLADPPAAAIGLAVPAMPVGSPGMEAGERFSAYRVLLLGKDGGHSVFARVVTQAEQYQ